MHVLSGQSVSKAREVCTLIEDNFCCKLLHVHDTVPAEVLDYIFSRLKSSIHMQVLVADSSTFAYAALLAEGVAEAHGETAHNGPQSMDLQRSTRQ